MLRVGTEKEGMGEAGEHLRTERGDERRRGKGRGEGFSSSLRAAANELGCLGDPNRTGADSSLRCTVSRDRGWHLILGWLSPVRTTQVRLELDSTQMFRLGLGVYLHGWDFAMLTHFGH